MIKRANSREVTEKEAMEFAKAVRKVARSKDESLKKFKDKK